MVRIGTAPGGAPIPFSFEPLLHIMQQGLDCTPDQIRSDLGGGSDIIIFCASLQGYLGVGTGGGGGGGQ